MFIYAYQDFGNRKWVELRWTNQNQQKIIEHV